MKGIGAKHKFIELRAQGQSYDSISKELGISKPTLLRWGKELSPKIDDRKILELETLQESYQIHRYGRLKAHGEQIALILGEIKSRDLKSVSTEKLFDLFVKLSNSLRTEYPSVEKENPTERALTLDEIEQMSRITPSI